MKYTFNVILTSFVFLATVPISPAEDVETFLKRVGTGATTNDLSENFHGMVIANGQTFEVDRDKILKNAEGQKAAGTNLTVDELKIISRTETPDKDGKGAVISIIDRVKVTEKVKGLTRKIESQDHHVILRDADGTFHSLYLVVVKQIRDA